MAKQSSKESNSIFSEVVSKLRQCLVFLLPGNDYPPLDRAVHYELFKLQMTPRDLRGLYRTFQQLRTHDSLTANVGAEETSTESVYRLVRHRREWVAKILKNVLELGGYPEVISWNGFLYVLLRLCVMSRMELAQVMFFVIVRDQKSWTVDYVTTAQLEGFFEYFADCPYRSFNTGDIGFSSLALAKFGMVEFIELTYRHSQLVAPIHHLQRSIQQALPGMHFWRDFDKVKLRNQKITLEHFRLSKVSSMIELLKKQRNFEKEMEKMHSQQVPKSDLPKDWVDPKIDVLDPRTEVRRMPEVSADLPIPLPGPELGKVRPPGWVQGRREKALVAPPMPAWITTLQKENLDPKTGKLLGSLAEPPPPPNWALPLGAAITTDMAKEIIQRTHKPPGFDTAWMRQHMGDFSGVTQLKGVDPESFIDRVTRNQELDFIRKSRAKVAPMTDILRTMDKVTQCEVINRRYVDRQDNEKKTVA